MMHHTWSVRSEMFWGSHTAPLYMLTPVFETSVSITFFLIGFFIELISPGNIDFSILSSCYSMNRREKYWGERNGKILSTIPTYFKLFYYFLSFILDPKNTHTFRIWGLFWPQRTFHGMVLWRQSHAYLLYITGFKMVDRSISPGSKKTPEPSMRVKGALYIFFSIQSTPPRWLMVDPLSQYHLCEKFERLKTD